MLPVLPRQFSWEGTFEYDLAREGHHWEYAVPDSWKRLPQTGDPVPFKNNVESLLGHQTKLNELLTSMGLRQPEWLLVNWLNNPDTADKKVGRGVTPVLNAVVKDATLHQFELLSTFAGDNMTVEIRGLCERSPCWFYLRGSGSGSLDALSEFFLADPSLFAKQTDGTLVELKSDDELKASLDGLRFIRVLHKYSITRFEKTRTHVQITLRDHVKVEDYAKGRVCGCIPLPGKGGKERKNEPSGVNSPEVVVTSPVVEDALEELSRIWQDPFAKSVLISAPPGAGKEVFASSIPYGNGRRTENFQSLSMASGEQKSLELQLYGCERPDGSVAEGLLAKAAKSALFLDEVHQTSAITRASLLRPLEADEYFPVQSNKKQEVNDVLFVMATSKLLEELKQFEPPDFWTRMTHAVHVKHPLDFTPSNGGPTLVEVIAKFFNCFWWDRTEKHYRTTPTFCGPIQDISAEPGMLLVHWQVHSMSKTMREGSQKPKCFAETFVEELNKNSMSPADFSVRGIRSMVTRLFSIASSNVAQGCDPWNDEDQFKRDVRAVFAEILKVAKL